MPREYDSCYAKCPFFLSSGKKNVVCEGITDECTLNLLFRSESARDLYRNTYCDEHYEKCEIYKVVEKKYEDK